MTSSLEGEGGVLVNDDKGYLTLAFNDNFQPSIIKPSFDKWCWGRGGPNDENTLYHWFYAPKEKIVTLRVVPGCEGPLTMVRNPTYAVLSRNQFCRELRAHGGG